MKVFKFFLFMLLLSCNINKKDKGNQNKNIDSTSIAPFLSFKVYKEYPHDTSSFTEGLFMNKGKLYESTGAPDELPNTKSLFGIVDSLGKIKTLAEIDKSKYFGEGIAMLDGKIFQLTYKNQIGFIYNSENFQNIGKFKYNNKEGWGLTTDSINLILSDGTNKITFLNPKTFQVVREIYVTDNKIDLMNINEMEYVAGFIYANIFTTDIVVKINPLNGKVISKINFESLHEQSLKKNPNSLEMNGIAFNSKNGHFLITGKMWPYIFEVTFN